MSTRSSERRGLSRKASGSGDSRVDSLQRSVDEEFRSVRQELEGMQAQLAALTKRLEDGGL